MGWSEVIQYLNLKKKVKNSDEFTEMQDVDGLPTANGDIPVWSEAAQKFQFSPFAIPSGTAMGVAIPTTNPGSPAGTVWYFATTPGTYSNFAGIIVTDEVLILSNATGSWVGTRTGISTYTLHTKSTPVQHVYYYSATNTAFVYGATYFGYNKPVANDSILTSVRMTLYGANSSHLGTIRQFIIGTVDQRLWLIPRLVVTCAISVVGSSFSGGAICAFDFTAQNLLMRAGEVLFCLAAPIAANASLALTTATYDANNKLYTTSSLSIALTANSTTNANFFDFDVIEIDSLFPIKEELEVYESQISALQVQTARINKYIDVITGNNYEIKVSNGTLILQSLDFTNILVIGHSFVTYANSPGIWELETGENRAMAASINANQWPLLLAAKFGASVTKLSGVDFERNYSTNYNFAGIWNVANTYDCICVYLNENAVYGATMQASWEAMLTYLKTACPSAKIYCTGAWATNTKQAAIQAACEATRDITYVDLVGYAVQSRRWMKGDYYFGKDSLYYVIGAVYEHPNDKGHLDIANRFLTYMGQDEITGNTFTVTLVQALHGTISTPNGTWVVDGIVTIRVTPDSGYAISSLTVIDSDSGVVTATQRTNTVFDGTARTYFTFVMPAKSVTVTPVWALA